MDVFNKHIPLAIRRVKNKQNSSWMNRDIIRQICRDKLKRIPNTVHWREQRIKGPGIECKVQLFRRHDYRKQKQRKKSVETVEAVATNQIPFKSIQCCLVQWGTNY